MDDRRSGYDRRLVPDRRTGMADGSVARLNLRMFGERRTGIERRSGVDRRRRA